MHKQVDQFKTRLPPARNVVKNIFDREVSRNAFYQSELLEMVGPGSYID